MPADRSSKFSIEKEFVGDVVVLHMSGGLAGEAAADRLREELDKLDGEGHRKLIFDLTEVSHLNPACLRLLLRANAKARRKDGHVRFVKSRSPAGEILNMAKGSRLSVFAGVEEALQGEVAKSRPATDRAPTPNFPDLLKIPLPRRCSTKSDDDKLTIKITGGPLGVLVGLALCCLGAGCFLLVAVAYNLSGKAGPLTGMYPLLAFMAISGGLLGLAMLLLLSWGLFARTYVTLGRDRLGVEKALFGMRRSRSLRRDEVMQVTQTMYGLTYGLKVAIILGIEIFVVSPESSDITYYLGRVLSRWSRVPFAREREGQTYVLWRPSSGSNDEP